ncbi:MAG: DUF6383 domain-containing protein [Parabacteroides sp.]
MNKKFSTLMAGFLLAATVGVTAQQNHAGNGEIPYRTDMVKSAVTSIHCDGVNKIESDKWYQLVINHGMEQGEEGVAPLGSATTVLTMERDYSTGALHLEAKKIEDAALTHSLWKIKFDEDAVSGHNYTFINKETGYALTFDHTRAVQLTAADAEAAVRNTEATILDGCNDMWTWYSNDDNGDTRFDNHLVYSYYHRTKRVMAMALNANNEVVLVSAPQDLAKVDASGLQNIISFQPVIAGAKVLSAAEINSMIDADASYKSFPPAAGNNASNLAGKLAKFLFNVTMTSNPLDASDYVAEDTQVAALSRDNYSNAEGSNVITAGQPSVYAGYGILFRKDRTTDKYLRVSTTYHEGATTSNYNGLKLEDATFANTAEIDATKARFHFKVTYYPTNDSLVIEPLNASMPNKSLLPADVAANLAALAALTPAQYLNTINAGVAYGTAAPAVANCLSNKAAGVPVALAAINFATPGNQSQVLTVSVPYGINADEVKFMAISKEGYRCSASSHALGTAGYPGNPAYITFNCDNHNGPGTGAVEYNADMKMKVTFDNTYNPLVRTTVANGVYLVRLSTANPDANDVTLTQKRADGSYIVADMGGHLVYDVLEADQDFKRMPATQWVIEQLGCTVNKDNADPTYNKTPRVKITNREYGVIGFEGQLYDAGNGKYYIINHEYANGMTTSGTVHATPAVNNFFSCGDTIYFEKVETPNTAGYSVIAKDVLAENVYALQHYNANVNNLFLGISATDNYIKGIPGDPTYYELHLIEGAQAYGYTSATAGATQLSRDVYAVKVKDANKIDNDHKYMALDHMHRYIVADEADIQAGKNGLTWAIFYLKENNNVDGTPYYALVNQNSVWTKTGADKKEIILNNNKTAGKMAIKQGTNESYIDQLCGTTSDVFALTSDPRPLYKSLSADAAYAEYVNNLAKSVTLSSLSGNEYLYEDSQSGILNYLAVENKSVQTKHEGLYVDYVAKSKDRMPQYLFAVAADSVKAYYYCGENAHGATHGLNPSCDHKVEYPGYVSGRFLVNLNDSIQNSINKVEAASKFQYDNYTRLAFVEAVHRGDSLFVLKAPYTLRGENAITGADADGNILIIPDYLAKDQEGIVYDAVVLDGTHNNAAFSLRYVGDTEEEGFLLESNDGQFSSVGSFEGAWLRFVNGTPVLAKFFNTNGNHNTGDIIDGNGSTGVTDFGQVLNQAAILTLGTVDKVATDNETINAVSEVEVSVINGNVIVKGAEGKKVVISNVLGQILVNTVITSSEATIAVPAGVVYVKVEGEAAVPAIVK